MISFRFSFFTIVLIFTCLNFAYASLPIIYDAGTYGCLPGSSAYTISSGSSISNTTHDSIYFSECYSTGDYSMSVTDADLTAGQTYTVYLHFAEIYHGAGNTNSGGGNGSRVFHVDIEGNRVLDSLDIHAMVGPAAALVFRYDVLIDIDGDLDLAFIDLIGDPKISAVEIRLLGEPSGFPPTTSIIDITSGVLPVELVSFTAKANVSGSTSVSWKTASEVNNLGFELEMARENEGFQNIVFLAGSGSKNEGAVYEFETDVLPAGEYRFRLNQIDMNGDIHTSNQVSVLVEPIIPAFSLLVFPNPSQGNCTLQLQLQQSQQISIHLFSYDGRRIGQSISKSVVAGEGIQIPLNLDQLSSGVYMVRISGPHFQAWEKIVLE